LAERRRAGRVPFRLNSHAQFPEDRHVAISIPLLALVPVLVGFALLDWRRLPLLARVSLGVATCFAFAAIQSPGVTATSVGELGTGLAVMVTAAKAAGAGAVLTSVLVKVRELAGS
jgi:hypothetical protein